MNILEFLYPNVCGICESISQTALCNKCKLIIKENIKNKLLINEKYKHLYAFKYEGIVRQKLIQYKFNEKAYLYKMFSEILATQEKIYEFIKYYDIIIPVPIHKERLKQRGYNQSELIAKEICKNVSELELGECIIKKSVNTVPQSLLKGKDREKNIKNAYILIDEQRINNKKVLIFDDIYTTGSTVNECSKVLKNAKEIGVMTIAKD